MNEKVLENIGNYINLESVWSSIDCICIKCQKDNFSASRYCLEGHPNYEKELLEINKLCIDKMREIGCYGTSELVLPIGTNMDFQKFDIKVNLKDRQQIEEILDFFDEYISEDIKKEVLKIDEVLSNLSRESEYRSLYHVATIVDKYGQIKGLKFYFKTFDIEESVVKRKLYINALEQFEFVREDHIYSFIKQILESSNVDLQCLGLELLNGERSKIKYYLKVKESMEMTFELLKEYAKKYNLSQCLYETMCVIDKFKELNIDIIQLTTDKLENNYINFYCKNNQLPALKRYYAIREGLVLRNIEGVYFLIDINEKKYYDLKRLYQVNQIGKVIIEYMQKHPITTISGIVSYLKTIIKNYRIEMYNQIYDDCEAFVIELQNKQYVTMVGENVC